MLATRNKASNDIMSQKLEDIAQLAGVSRSTVSRVINNHPNVREHTRAKVLQVIEETGFRPNPAARTLVTQCTQVIGMVIPTTLNVVFEDPTYYPTLLQGVAEAANERDYGMLLWMGQSGEDEARFHQRILQNRLMDGLVIASAREGDPLVEHLIESKLPFTMVERPFKFHDQISYVSVDNVRAAQIAVEHLLGLGYRRIGTVTGAMDNADGQDRLTGYKNALQRAGVPIDDNLVVEGRFTYQTGYLGMKQLLKQAQDIEAVFTASDRTAMGVLQALNDVGLRVPDDIALVSFDDMLYSAEATPPLTTIRQPTTQQGADATSLLIDLIEGVVQGPRQILLPTQLVIRESCGAGKHN